MAFEVYSHKQQPNGILESPQTNLGYAQTPQQNTQLQSAQVIGGGVAAARIIPAAKQVFNTYLESTGDLQLQRTIKRVSTAGAIGIEFATIGFVGTVGVEVIKFIVNAVSGEKQEEINQIDQNYIIQKRGVALDKFIGEGVRID